MVSSGSKPKKKIDLKINNLTLDYSFIAQARKSTFEVNKCLFGDETTS